MVEMSASEIKAFRARLMADVSPEALERCERERAHFESWGNPKRCETGQCAPMGECLFCWAINGESCRK